MQEPAKWDRLLATLLEICEELRERTSLVPKEHVPVRIVDAMFLKSVDTLRGIQLLYRSDLSIQAQVLIRILLELRIDIELFMKSCASNPAAAARKVLDAMMLQKFSQQRQSHYLGLDTVPGAPSRKEMEKREKRLVAKYGEETAKKMRRNGFTGWSIEDRARAVGLSTEYNIIYRNFSRNIHNTDYMEHLAQRGAISAGRWQDYQDTRDHTALSTAIACVWRTAWFVDSILERTYLYQLGRYWQRCIAFEYWVPEAAQNIGAGTLP
jgi:hypothetical protein